MKTLCDCEQYPIYPGSDECRVCDGSYKLTIEERASATLRLPRSQAVALAIMCAEEVLPLWKGDDGPARAIQAAKNWLANPTKRNRKIANDAASRAFGSAYGADTTAYVAYAAAQTAEAVAFPTILNTTNVAFYVVRSTAYAGNDIHDKVDRWLYENL